MPSLTACSACTLIGSPFSSYKTIDTYLYVTSSEILWYNAFSSAESWLYISSEIVEPAATKSVVFSTVVTLYASNPSLAVKEISSPLI